MVRIGSLTKVHTGVLLISTLHWHPVCHYHFDGLVQERRNSRALALELRLSCTNPSIWKSISIARGASNNSFLVGYFWMCEIYWIFFSPGLINHENYCFRGCATKYSWFMIFSLISIYDVKTNRLWRNKEFWRCLFQAHIGLCGWYITHHGAESILIDNAIGVAVLEFVSIWWGSSVIIPQYGELTCKVHGDIIAKLGISVDAILVLTHQKHNIFVLGRLIFSLQ